MKRILCLWFPRWPLERLLAAQPELRGQDVLLYEQTPQGALRVVAGTSSAFRPGMPVAEAMASAALKNSPAQDQHSALRTPSSALHILCHDPWADRQALLELAEACHQFSPTVGIEDASRPSSLFLDLTGLPDNAGLKIADGELGVDWPLLSGITLRAAMAETIGAAWGLAHYATATPRNTSSIAQHVAVHVSSPSAIGALPAAALRLPEDTLTLLSRLGLHRVGQMEALPRPALAARFGPMLLLRLDQMYGRAAEVLRSPKAAAEIVAEFAFETPVEDTEAIHAVCRSLVGKISSPLAARREGVVQCQCRFDCLTAEPVVMTVSLYRPSASADHLWQLLRLRLDSVRLRAPVSAVRMEVLAAAPLSWHQQELFETAERPSANREAALLIDRLSNRLGRQAVSRPTLLSDVQPEHACLYLPLAGQKLPAARSDDSRGRRSASSTRSHASPSSAALAPCPDHRPTTLKRQAVLLEQMTQTRQGMPRSFRLAGRNLVLSRVWGPERIETGWWRTRLVRRDYYRVEARDGGRYWIFHELRTGRWFLHGVFD